LRNPIDVLIVDDSAVMRGLLARAIESDSNIRVAGTAMHGEAALSWLSKNSARVVILDVEMPVMDGLTALQEIQKLYPDVRCVMASGLTTEGAETTVRALSLGAAGCIAKPAADSVAQSIKQLTTQLVPLIKALGRPQRQNVSAKSAASGTSGNQTAINRFALPSIAPKLLVIGSSTGGPQALREVLTALPQDFALPIIITQHMPPMFTPMLAKHIAKDTGRPCAEATDGGLIERGHTYIAPGDFHVTIDKQNDRMITRLNQEEPEHYCRPSVNPMFRSAAQWYGKSLLGMMLTGIGEDGIEGTKTLVENNGYMLAQDEASSVVWGMPAAVVREGYAHQILPLKEMAAAILHLTTREASHV